MPNLHRARLRPSASAALVILSVSLLATGCGSTSPTPPAATPSEIASLGPTATPDPTPTPEPTSQPTPRFTNIADPELTALIPDQVGGATVEKPPVTEFAMTPGDIGEVYGEIGAQFTSLQVAYIAPRRLSLYAMRTDAPFATTADLEPYLAAAGEYVGIAGLHREPWQLKAVADHLVWVRPEDNATALGTMVYTWATDGFVFLMLGTDDALNTAMLSALPAETPPTPSPRPSRSPQPSASASG